MTHIYTRSMYTLVGLLVKLKWLYTMDFLIPPRLIKESMSKMAECAVSVNITCNEEKCSKFNNSHNI